MLQCVRWVLDRPDHQLLVQHLFFFQSRQYLYSFQLLRHEQLHKLLHQPFSWNLSNLASCILKKDYQLLQCTLSLLELHISCMLVYRKMFDDYRHVHHFVRDRHHDHVIDCEIDHDHDHHLGVSVICSDLLRETLRDWNFDIERDQMSGNRDICLCNPLIILIWHVHHKVLCRPNPW